MTLPTIFDICVPRDDVRQGALNDSDFAADLAQILRGEGPDDLRVPERFFAGTYPTRGIKEVLRNVGLRITGVGGAVSPIFRLSTQFGGGKTHALIGLAHLAGGMQGVKNRSEFIEDALVPSEAITVAAFDGENADPSNGRVLDDGVRAFTPWGELAWQIGGFVGYSEVQASDVERRAPGADTLRRLFAGRPALILLDELAIWLRKVKRGEEDPEDSTSVALRAPDEVQDRNLTVHSIWQSWEVE